MSTLLRSAALIPLFACWSAPALSVSGQDAGTGTRRNVAILVYQGVELLDFAGPGEVFSAAQGPSGRAFTVYTVAKSRAPVTSQGFVSVTPEFALADCPRPDLLVIPGGAVPDDDAELQAWVRKTSSSCELVLSVCNGAMLLGSTGLLDGLEVTTHHGSLQSLALLAPKARVLTNRRFVDSGHVVTAAGVSAGIDGALHVVERLLGAEAAAGTARYMEYEWRPAEIAALHAEPGQPVAEGPGPRLAGVARERGTAAAVAEYRALAKPAPEGELNQCAYGLLGAGRRDEAKALFELVVAVFPDSANAHDSLAEACLALGDEGGAIRHTEEALAKLKARPPQQPERAAALSKLCTARLARLRGEQSGLCYGCTPCGGGCDGERYPEAGNCPRCGMVLIAVQAVPAQAKPAKE